MSDYRSRVAGLDVVGGAVVSGSFQAYDQTYLVDALAQSGPASSAWPTSRRTSATPRCWRWPRPASGRSGSTCSAAVTSPRSPSRRVCTTLAGWHLEVYLDARDLPELAPRLALAPRLVIDHLGMTQAGLPALLGLVKDGAYVKASGSGGSTSIRTRPCGRSPRSIRPLRCSAQTSPARARSGRSRAADVELVGEAAGERALYDNALALYR